jgi:methyl-accepting chemotaxis protein
MTSTATGTSSRTHTHDAAHEAAQSALKRLGDARPSFGFVFASPRHELPTAIETVCQVSGARDVIGCSTAGEITASGLTHGGLAVMLVSATDSAHRTAFASGLRTDFRRAASELCEPFGELAKSAGTRGLSHLTSVVLTDGLAGTGEQLVAEMLNRTRVVGQIVGGAAGDEGAFRATNVAGFGRSGTDASAALHVFGSKPWGVGVNHGLRATTKGLRVTRARDNVVYELDGRPAFEAYQKHAAERGTKLTRENAGPYLIGNELGIRFFERVTRARAPLSVGEDGSLVCAAAIPEGAMVSILDGEPDSLEAAAKAAAEEAARALDGAPAAGVLLFDCICRGMILKDRFQREIDAVRGVLANVPIAGFLTYGEIARYPGSLDGWHNATAVVVAIPA